MRLRGTKTSTVSSSQGLGDQLYDLGGARPTLDLNFANNDSLADSITGKTLPTFTRASSATYVDGDGVIKTTPVNLLPYSERFDQASWVRVNSTVTINTTNAPDGTATASLFSRTTTSTGNYVGTVGISKAAATVTYTGSIYFKKNNARYASIRIQSQYPARVDAIFDLDTGTVYSATQVTVGDGFTNRSASIQDVGGGWYRATLTGTSNSATSLNLNFGCSAEPNQIDGTSTVVNSVYIWGAQLEESSTATEYIPTTSTISGAPRFDHDPATGESLGLLIEEARTNLTPYSSPYNSWWNKPNLNHTSASVDNPFNYSAVRRHRATTTSNPHYFYRNDGNFLNANTDYTFSAFVAPEGTGADAGKIQLRIFLIGADAGSINFDLNTGQFNAQAGTSGTTAGGFSWSISDYGMQLYADGWYRVWMTFQSSSTCSVGIVSINSLNAPDFQVYTSAATGGYYVTGIQVEQGLFRTSVIPTDGATVTRAADVAEITGNKFAKTNLLQYSERFDNAVWLKQSTASVTPNVAVAPDGTQTADLASFPGAGDRLYQSVSVTGTVTLSCYVRSVSGSVNTRMQIYNATDGSLAKNFTATTEWQRVSFTTTLTAATSGFYPVGPLQAGQEFYVWGAQLETGDELTEYTPSVESFVSRASSATYVDDTTGLIKTTPVNLVYPSESINAGVGLWATTVSAGTITVTPDYEQGPYGTNTATRVEATKSGNTGNHFAVLQAVSSISGTSVGSIWIKSNTGSNQTIYFRVDLGGAEDYNLTVTPEWQRYEIIEDEGAGPCYLSVGLRGGSDNSCDISIWGAQLEEGSTASPYIKTTSTISGAARYENGELILEEARTNRIDRNTTNYNSIWSNSVPSGAYNNAGIAPDGTNTAFATTAYGVRGQKNYSMTPDTNDYTFSIFIKSTGGQGKYITYGTGFYTGDSDTGGNTAYDFATDTVGHGYSRKLYANGWVRVWKTYTNTNINLFLTSNGPGTSLDMLFWGAQLEQGSNPSSLIITPTGANVTRAADVSTSALGVDSFYNQSEGTAFLEFAIKDARPWPGYKYPFYFGSGSGGTGAHFVFGRANAGNGTALYLNENRGAGTYRQFVPVDYPLINRIATGIGTGDFTSCFNGNPPWINDTNYDASGLLVPDSFKSQPLNLHLRRLAYFPTRLPNANLQNITS